MRRLAVRLMTGVALVATLVRPAPAMAQMELGVIKGRVVDDAGAPLGNVSIKLTNVERGREVTLKTGKDGRFYRRGMQAGEYAIVVELDGYQAINDKLRLVAGTDRDFDFTLARAAAAGSAEFQAGVAAFSAGDYAGAVTRFQEAIAKAPTVEGLHVNLALAYLRLQRMPEAVASLERAAELAPGDAAIQYQLGSAYVDTRNYDKAAAALLKGLGPQPKLATDAMALEAVSTLGAVYFAQGKLAEAEAEFKRVLGAKPGAAAATLGLGKIHFSRNDVDQALKLFDQVVADHPGTPEAAQAAAFIKELRKGNHQGGRL